MGELNISPPWGDLRGAAHSSATQEKRVSMVQIYIYVFLKIADLESLCKMEHFVTNKEIYCTAIIKVLILYIYICIIFQNKYINSDAAIHVLTCRSTSQWPTRKSYKNRFLFQKECSRPCNFCRKANKVGQAYHTCIICYTCVLSVLN